MATQWIPRPIEQVFGFFSDEKNLEKVTPPDFHLLLEKKSGAVIRYRLKLFGVPLRRESRIDRSFVPLKNGTLIKDDVRYRVRGGRWVSPLVGRFVRHDIKKMFDSKRSKIREIFP